MCDVVTGKVRGLMICERLTIQSEKNLRLAAEIVLNRDSNCGKLYRIRDD